ncbi:MAG: hypothetical protein HRT89_04595 [Lentisphaeria bacterium]|nr:hypothetical protein [Lentisphaeria bacterium]NQZ67326.1 hypothetical protein [Lentisphaeria bacterium]
MNKLLIILLCSHLYSQELLDSKNRIVLKNVLQQGLQYKLQHVYTLNAEFSYAGESKTVYRSKDYRITLDVLKLHLDGGYTLYINCINGKNTIKGKLQIDKNFKITFWKNKTTTKLKSKKIADLQMILRVIGIRFADRPIVKRKRWQLKDRWTCISPVPLQNEALLMMEIKGKFRYWKDPDELIAEIKFHGEALDILEHKRDLPSKYKMSSSMKGRLSYAAKKMFIKDMELEMKFKFADITHKDTYLYKLTTTLIEMKTLK